MKTVRAYATAIACALLAPLRDLIRKSPPLLEYAPDGWGTKLPEVGDGGWHAAGVVEAERAKWSLFLDALQGSGALGFNHEHGELSLRDHLPFHNINMTFGYVLGVAAHLKTSLSILDYGGGLGHYYRIGRALLPGVELEYACKEVGPMSEAGRALTPEIAWHTDDSCLDATFDLVIIGGSLQYVEKWQDLLERIAGSVGGYLYLTGIPTVRTGAPFVAIQQAYGTRMLHQQFRRDELLEVVDATGLVLLREFVLEDCPQIANAPSQCRMGGWLFKRENQ